MASNEYFYGGKTYNLDPKYGSPIMYGSNFSQLSSALDPRTANQIKEATETLNTGIRNLEVGNVQPDVFESVPKQHFKEMNRLAKLTGAKLSFHAPMIDPTGITEHGWEKMNQDAAEKQLWSAIEKSQELNPGENVVTFHASSVPLPSAEFKIKDGKTEKVKSMILIDPQGKLHPIKEEEKYFPLGIKGEKVGAPIPTSPKFEDEIRKQNDDLWSQQLSQLNFYSQRGTSEMGDMNKLGIDKLNFKELKKEENSEWKKWEGLQMHAALDLSEAYRQLKSMYELAYKSAKNTGDNKTIKELDIYANKILPLAGNFENIRGNKENLQKFSDLIEEGVNLLGEKKPEILRPLRDFAIEKSAETTANLALRGYNEFKDKAPIIALENHPAQQSLLTTGEDLRDVIKKAQKLFIEKAKKEGMSEGEATKQAEKLIGATWDVGHINMMRRFGYDKSDILKQTDAVAPFVKKVHLSDNFGFEHTELPMGMGNVPMKEIMEKIGKEGYDVKKVIEAGNWWQHFSPGGKTNSPLVPTMQGLGTQMYGGSPGWNQIYGTPGGYFTGYGTMLPEQHFSLYGAGFSNLPMELGGQISGKDSRFSGTPMS